MPETETVNTAAHPPSTVEDAPPQREIPANDNRAILDAAIEESARHQLEHLQYEEQKFSFQQRRATLFAKSGLFAVKDVDGQQAIAQAMVKIELGESMGFSPAESLQGINIIQGVTAVAAALRAARMQARGWTWQIQWIGPESDCAGVRLWLYFRGKPYLQPKRDPRTGEILRDNGDGNAIMEHVSVAYTKDDASKMLTTLWENGQKRRASILEKDNWKMSPKNMYFARAVTNAQRWHDPGALSVNLPSVEEVMDVDHDSSTREVMRSAISLSNLKPSAESNRGHQATAPQQEPSTTIGSTPEGAVSEGPVSQPATDDTPAVAAQAVATSAASGPHGASLFDANPPEKFRDPNDVPGRRGRR